jgi:hypothetical protein
MILQGEDKAIKITISSAAGVLQDIDAIANIILYIYLQSDDSILIKYAKVAAAGFTTLLRVSATEYTAILPKSVLDSQPLTNLMIEAELQETDSRFTDNIRRTKGTGTITEIEKSLITE